MRDRRQQIIASFWAALLLAVAIGAGLPCSVKAASGSPTVTEGIAIAGSVSNSTINNTVNKQDPVVLAAMTKTFADQMAATTEARAKAEAKAAELAQQLGFTSSAVGEFFKILGEQNVPEEKIPARLIEIATHFAQTRDELAALEPDDPQAAELVRWAKQALETGRLVEADDLLNRAKEAELAAFRQAREFEQKAREAMDRHAFNAAKLLAGRGNIALTQLRYPDAAQQFKQAAALVPPGHSDETANYLQNEADAAYRQGDEQGDNNYLKQSIEIWQVVLQYRPRDRVPTGWAMTQTNLGNALESLGERESGTERLQQAVAAYRAALEVQRSDPLNSARTQNNLGAALERLGERESSTARLEESVGAFHAALAAGATYYAALEEDARDRVFWSSWAMTQVNLGAALQTLGARESGTARLAEAVAAYRAALEEYLRDRAPLQWAKTEMDLGNVLQTLWERDGETPRLEEAVAAYRAALEEGTRLRAPLQWAATQTNLGTALERLGERESGPARLQEAVTAYRAALEECTRARAPLQWAVTQNDLGIALKTLGERDGGTAQLEESVGAYRAALTVYTPNQMPLQWAITEMNLGNVLQTLGLRESGTARLEAAVAAYLAALERDPLPVDVARIQFNKGLALVALDRRAHNTDRLKEALGDFRQAEATFRAVGMAHWAETSGHWIVRLRDEINTNPPGDVNPQEHKPGL
jgi:tetratricopeptide (TPR) repeat protein